MSSADKRNQFLDAGDSDDDNRDDNSDEELEKGGRVAKRRKVDEEEDEESDFGDLSDEEEELVKRQEEEAAKHEKTKKQPKNNDEQNPTEAEESKTDSKEAPITPRLVKPLSKKNLVATEKAIKKSGVVYLSRVPPYMKPVKLRSLLSPFGELNRIFLAPEDAQAHAKRVRAGGNKRRMFIEGWIEWVDKKAAKRACELLNGRPIGGKKGNFYRDDIWSLKYLSSFKWQDLTKQIDAENAERAQRLRAEISQTTRENKEFVRNIEKGKMLDNMQAKAKRKKAFDEDDSGEAPTVAATAESETAVSEMPGQERRTFKQIPLAKKRKVGEGSDEQPEQVKRVLSKIF